MKSKYIKIVVSTVIIIFLLLLLLMQLGVFSGKQIEPGQIQNTDKAVSYNKAKVIEKTVPVIYKTTGTIDSRNNIEISSRLTARLNEILCKDGDKVKKGQILAVLENNELKAAVSKAEMNLKTVNSSIAVAEESIKAAQAELKRAKAEFYRDKQLSKTRAVSYQLFEQSESGYTQAIVAVKQAELSLAMALSDKQAAESSLSEAKTMLSYSYIKSPINGVVAEKLADIGDIAIPGKILFKVFDPDTLMLEIPVRESLINKIKVGNKISFYVSALNKKYSGEIKEVVPLVDYNTRTFMVKICIGKDNSLVPGMYGEASIDIGSQKVSLVPSKAITRVGQLETVNLIKDSNLKKIYVKTIQSEVNGFSIVLSGLKPGDEIEINK